MTVLTRVPHRPLPVENLHHWRRVSDSEHERPRAYLRSAARLFDDSDPLTPSDRMVWVRRARQHFAAGRRSAPLALEFADRRFAEVARRAAFSPARLSVLVPIRGAHVCLALALACLAERTASPEWEVVLTCQESEGDEVERIARGIAWPAAARRVAIVTTPEPQGFPANVNLARIYAEGGRLAILNTDTYVPEAWDARLAVVLSSPGVSGVGPAGQVVVPELDPTSTEAVRECDRIARAATRGANVPDHVAPTGRLVGFCFMLYARDFDLVGGLWEGYGLGNFDDDDLSFKLRFLGVLRTAPFLVAHGWSQSFRRLDGGAALYEELLRENGAKFHERWTWAADLLPPEPMETTIVHGTPGGAL